MKITGIIRVAVFAVLLFGALVTWVGCESRGPARRAGEAIDQGIQDARDAIDPPGPLEKVGRGVDVLAP